MKFSRRRAASPLASPQLRRRPRSVPKLLILGGLALAVVFLFGDHGLFSLTARKRERTRVLAEIDSLRAVQEKLVGERDRLEHDLQYVEELARNRYRMARPGEKVFRVIPRPESGGGD